MNTSLMVMSFRSICPVAGMGEFGERPDTGALYRSLRTNNPAPFAGMVRWNDFVLMSSSPERLVKLRDGEVQSRPIAGTRPRGSNHDADQA